MAMKEPQHMVRTPWPWWLAFKAFGAPTKRDGADVVREAMQKGAEVMGIALPECETKSAAERAAAKLKKAEAEVERLRGMVR